MFKCFVLLTVDYFLQQTTEQIGDIEERIQSLAEVLAPPAPCGRVGRRYGGRLYGGSYSPQ